MRGSSLVLLRLALGLFALCFALLWGQAAGRLRRNGRSPWRARTEMLRALVTLAAVCWLRRFDVTAIVIVLLSAGCFAFGFRMGMQGPREEHLERVMFPED